MVIPSARARLRGSWAETLNDIIVIVSAMMMDGVIVMSFMGAMIRFWIELVVSEG